MVKASAKLQKMTFYRFQHLPSNSIIANVVLFDLDLVFTVKYFKCKYLETVSASGKLPNMTFVDVNICYLMASLRML